MFREEPSNSDMAYLNEDEILAWFVASGIRTAVDHDWTPDDDRPIQIGNRARVKEAYDELPEKYQREIMDLLDEDKEFYPDDEPRQDARAEEFEEWRRYLQNAPRQWEIKYMMHDWEKIQEEANND